MLNYYVQRNHFYCKAEKVAIVIYMLAMFGFWTMISIAQESGAYLEFPVDSSLGDIIIKREDDIIVWQNATGRIFLPESSQVELTITVAFSDALRQIPIFPANHQTLLWARHVDLSTTDFTPLINQRHLESIRLGLNPESMGERHKSWPTGLHWIKNLSVGGNSKQVDAALRGISQLPFLHKIAVHVNQLSQASIREIGACKKLAELTIRTRIIEGNSIQLDMPIMKSLRIYNSRIDSCELNMPVLEELCLLRVVMGRDTFSVISRFTNLKEIQLDIDYQDNNGNDYNAWLKYLNSLHQLESVILYNYFNAQGLAALPPNTKHLMLATDISNDDLHGIAHLHNLESLNISGHKINDNCLPILSRLVKLSSLVIHKSGITDDAILTLAKELPNCQMCFQSNTRLVEIVETGKLSDGKNRKIGINGYFPGTEPVNYDILQRLNLRLTSADIRLIEQWQKCTRPAKSQSDKIADKVAVGEGEITENE